MYLTKIMATHGTNDLTFLLNTYSCKLQNLFNKSNKFPF